MPYWDERVKGNGAEVPGRPVDQFHIDILCAHFVRGPSASTCVGSNLFGDILSDLVRE